MYKNIMLSVVAPMYNEQEVIGAYIQTTLDILSKNFANYELILVDDGSTDDTVAVCSAYMQGDSALRLISFSRNYGHEIASTAGLEHALGDYVVFDGCRFTTSTKSYS